MRSGNECISAYGLGIVADSPQLAKPRGLVADSPTPKKYCRMSLLARMFLFFRGKPQIQKLFTLDLLLV